MSTNPHNSRPWWTDPSLIGLLIANVVTIWLVLREQPSITNVLWIYWGQSVVIGLLTIVRMFLYGTATKTMMREIQESNASIAPATANRIAKWLLAPLFLLHYGGFHVGYAIFLAVFSADFNNATGFGGQETNVYLIIYAVLFFALAHGYSLIRHHHQELLQPRAVDEFMIRAYRRIVPMHLTIVLGGLLASFLGGSVLLLLLFVGLKAASDIGAHIAEHRNDA